MASAGVPLHRSETVYYIIRINKYYLSGKEVQELIVTHLNNYMYNQIQRRDSCVSPTWEAMMFDSTVLVLQVKAIPDTISL